VVLNFVSKTKKTTSSSWSTQKNNRKSGIPLSKSKHNTFSVLPFTLLSF